MLDSTLLQKIRAELVLLDISKSCQSIQTLSQSAQTYLEFYGYLQALKESPVDYFWGYRPCLLDGQTLPIATYYWRHPSPKGTLFFVHGLFDHVGLFQEAFAILLKQQWSIIAIDLPGHGLSGGAPTAIQSFYQYGEVISEILNYFEPELRHRPLLGLGQSTGTAALMSTLFRPQPVVQKKMFDAMIFWAPLVRPKTWPMLKWVYPILSKWVNHLPRTGGITNTHNQAFIHFLKHFDPLQARDLSMQWLGALRQWMTDVPTFSQVSLPLLIVQGTADGVVDWRYNLPELVRHFPRSQVRYIEGAMHHLANETDVYRNPLLAATTQYLRQWNSVV